MAYKTSNRTMIKDLLLRCPVNYQPLTGYSLKKAFWEEVTLINFLCVIVPYNPEKRSGPMGRICGAILNAAG
uniref:Uncharacterized protein n=1 Tax=Cannabis sativa TaxID=3483 RepID=A0A803QKR7_CANSA